ncbi:RsmB/NOP family class I SAM-dependent RNA methyltransferase [Paracoccus sanguinis]|uniref:16S rRNA (Cytosine967-C5)-methyltransferase n=1 Tax=Paracoccus sanguinis TaxID=1545044 RepID=A0A1H2RVB5_9RHOB|nr:RsmB/NOP family class I SAM-dependent RNA methyltransferase [Paracoccus sanguinis]KGJ18946.1 SAM-dependent methlyltransferase [Paracoccus sanguinis]SDW23426.1 16S rRNA (cytosine967-C5)-methyltransferase [Paracoccus sanguinis]
MTPAARASAAIEILDDILAGSPAEPRLIRWARSSRYAGSGDRAAVRDLVFDALRRRRSHAALGGADTGRGLILGALREAGHDPDTIFAAAPYASPPLTPAERDAGRPPSRAEATDLPDWIADRLAADLGNNFPAVASALRERAPVWLRVNLARGTRENARAELTAAGVETSADPRCDTALLVTSGARSVQGSAAYREGLVELQDLSPQMACAALNVGPKVRVLDLCAGGGGKSLALAARGAKVTAWDATPARMRDLPARAARAGAAIDIAPALPSGPFDLVVADVPCSGSGTWRRTPDAKWRLTTADLEQFVAVQAGILDTAAARVAPGGRLAYMTCSLFAAENAGQIDAFLRRNPSFALNGQRTLTPLDASDGFFVAELSSLMPA